MRSPPLALRRPSVTSAGRARGDRAAARSCSTPTGATEASDVTFLQGDRFVAWYGDGVRLRLPVFETVGNHDEVEGPYVEAQVARRHGGRFYSWDWDAIHLVALAVVHLTQSRMSVAWRAIDREGWTEVHDEALVVLRCENHARRCGHVQCTPRGRSSTDEHWRLQMKRGLLVVAIAIATAACGKSAIPADRLGRTEGAIQGAQAMGATQEPSAALHLRLANENLARAKKLISDGENDRARYVLMRAEADANLARSLVNEARAKYEADRAQREIQMMQSSMRQGS